MSSISISIYYSRWNAKCSIGKSTKRKIITSIQIAKGGKNINHSLFVDDTLLLGIAWSIIKRRFKKVLDDFLKVSGGLLNNSKCRIYGWNTPRIMQNISQILEITTQARWTHFTYLGLPIANENVKVEVWNKHVEKWRTKYKNGVWHGSIWQARWLWLRHYFQLSQYINMRLFWLQQALTSKWK